MDAMLLEPASSPPAVVAYKRRRTHAQAGNDLPGLWVTSLPADRGTRRSSLGVGSHPFRRTGGLATLFFMTGSTNV